MYISLSLALSFFLSIHIVSSNICAHIILYLQYIYIIYLIYLPPCLSRSPPGFLFIPGVLVVLLRELEIFRGQDSLVTFFGGDHWDHHDIP